MTAKIVILCTAPIDRIIQALGFIPHWLDDENLEPAAVQLGTNYQHGGGWRPFCTSKSLGTKFTLNEKDMSIKYPGDPAHKPIAKIVLRDEEVYMYDHAWVMIFDTKDKSWEICRMD